MTFLQKKRRPKLLVLGGGIKIIQQQKILRVFIKYVFPLKIGYVESKLSFLRTFLRFHNALSLKFMSSLNVFGAESIHPIISNMK